MEVSWNGDTGIPLKIDGLFHGKSDLGGFGSIPTFKKTSMNIYPYIYDYTINS